MNDSEGQNYLRLRDASDTDIRLFGAYSTFLLFLYCINCCMYVNQCHAMPWVNWCRLLAARINDEFEQDLRVTV